MSYLLNMLKLDEYRILIIFKTIDLYNLHDITIIITNPD